MAAISERANEKASLISSSSLLNLEVSQGERKRERKRERKSGLNTSNQVKALTTTSEHAKLNISTNSAMEPHNYLNILGTPSEKPTIEKLATPKLSPSGTTSTTKKYSPFSCFVVLTAYQNFLKDFDFPNA